MEPKVLLIIPCLFMVIHNVISHSMVQKLPNDLYFDNFVRKYNKYYANDTNEYHKRSAIFWDNYRAVEELNLMRTDNFSAWYGINKFSDLTADEFKDQYLSGYVRTVLPADKPVPNLMLAEDWKESQLPKRVDWRDKSVVTPVNDQKNCGGCWAYSIVENLESHYAIKYGELLSFSVQEILDCSMSYKTLLAGCLGGQPCAAFSWLNETQTILESASKYPLKNKNQFCTIVPKTAEGLRVQGFMCKNYTGSEASVLSHLANEGPLSVAVDASNWINYQGGIIQYHCPQDLNHAVQIVGYDISGDVPYYIVRNSWGKDWGLDGYLHLRYGVNMCGIANEVSWATKIEKV